jgi:PAS domain S-box-containing protein
MLEDNPRDAELIERQLQRAQLDFSSTVVDDEPGFRAALENSDPDVILSDNNLPDFDGVSALRIARVLAPSTPFIFVSGSIGEERAVETLREGATDYVLKDRLSRLGSAIVRALAEKREKTLRQSMENALRASEKRFQHAAAATREIIWDWDLATSRIWFNNALRDHWGYDGLPSEMPSTWFWQRVHPDERAAVRNSIADCLLRGERWTTEFRFARGDDSYSHVIVRGIVIADEGGTPVRVIGAVLDITERIQLESQLGQARRIESLGRVAATVAHEFNNVLMGILPLAEFIRRSADIQSPTERMAAQMIESISRGRRLTDQILRYSRPAEPAFSEIDLGTWLRDSLPELRALAGERVRLTLHAPESPLPVLIDAPQIHQVLSNLVVNARDAMERGGNITLVVEEDDDTISLTVADDGSGMPKDIVDHIFEPLFTTKRSGTGLGLAVAQQIIARHRGCIRVTSACGKGTSFRIDLPRAGGMIE